MATTKKKSNSFSDAEKAAMKERARELKAEERWKKDKAAGEADVLAKIGEMKGSDRTMAKRIHALVKESAPDLMPRTWYGMPAYAKDDKVAERPDEPLRLRTGSLEGDARCFEATLRRRQKTCPGLGRRPDR